MKPLRSLSRRGLLGSLLSLPAGVSATPTRVPLIVGEGPRSAKVMRLLDWVAGRANLQWELRHLPWKRGQMLAAAGEGLMWGLSRNRVREQSLRFSLPVNWYHLWVLVRSGDRVPTQLKDLEGRRLCMVAGSSHAELLNDHGVKVARTETATRSEAVMRMLQRGRCDLVLATLETRHRPTAESASILPSRPPGVELAPEPLLARSLHFATGHESTWLGVLKRIDELALSDQAALDRLSEAL